MEQQGGAGGAVEACSAGVALPLGVYALTVDPAERTKPAKKSGSISTCLAQAGSVADRRHLR